MRLWRLEEVARRKLKRFSFVATLHGASVLFKRRIAEFFERALVSYWRMVISLE